MIAVIKFQRGAMERGKDNHFSQEPCRSPPQLNGDRARFIVLDATYMVILDLP
jgi:hypothetical protein